MNPYRPTVCNKNALYTWLLAIGARRHGQEGALDPLWKCYKVFCALVVTAKRSVDELWPIYALF